MGKDFLIKIYNKMEQNWGESWVIPKNVKESNSKMQQNALLNNNQAVYKGSSNTTYHGANHDGKKYAQIMESEDTSVQTVGHDVKIAIQKARQQKGWNQKQLAQEIGVKPDIIRDYECGKAIPDNALIAKIEKKTGVKLPRAPKKKKVIWW